MRQAISNQKGALGTAAITRCGTFLYVALSASVFLFSCTGSSMRTASSAKEPPRPIVWGYYPSWDKSLPPDRINYSQFTHLCHAFITSDADGKVKKEGNLPSRELTSLGHANGVKVLVSLGGMDSGEYFSPMLRNRAAAERFVEGVMRLVIDYDYDGIDLDWEFPRDAQDGENLTWLARQFRFRLDKEKPGALLTTAQPGVDWAALWFDEKALEPLFDLVNVMTYDMHGPWSGHAGYNDNLYVDAGDREECRKTKSFPLYMSYWTNTKKFPKSKLLVGIPLYARGFPVEKWHEPFSRSDRAKCRYIAYKDMLNILNEGWTKHWDEAAGVPWLSKPGVKEVIQYDDERSAAMKGKWAAAEGYAGIFFWEISLDSVGGEHVLVKAATEGFTGR